MFEGYISASLAFHMIETNSMYKVALFFKDSIKSKLFFLSYDMAFSINR